MKRIIGMLMVIWPFGALYFHDPAFFWTITALLSLVFGLILIQEASQED